MENGPWTVMVILCTETTGQVWNIIWYFPQVNYPYLSYNMQKYPLWMEMKWPGERYGAFHSFETAFLGKPWSCWQKSQTVESRK